MGNNFKTYLTQMNVKNEDALKEKLKPQIAFEKAIKASITEKDVKGYHEYLDKSMPDPTLGINKYTKIYKDYDYNLNQIFAEVKSGSKEDIPTIKINNDGETINLIGKGTYEAQYGTEFEVRVQYYDKNGREKRDLATKEEIFTVKPQMIKTR